MKSNKHILKENESKKEVELYKVKLELEEQKRLLQRCENKLLQEKLINKSNYLL